MNTKNWNAEDYAQNAGAQYKWAQELLTKVTIQPNMHILDIGCGDGKITHNLAQMVPNGTVFGIDFSAEMIALAQTQYTHRNLQFNCMHAENMSVPYGFDFAFSNACLHWIKDHKPVMKGVAEALKPGGRFLFQMGGKGNVQTVKAAVEKHKTNKYRQYFEGFEYPYFFPDPEYYETICHNTTIQIARAELVPKTMQHTLESFCGWFRTTWFPAIDCVPVEMQNEFIADVAKTIFENATVLDGVAQIPMVRLEVEGIKI